MDNLEFLETYLHSTAPPAILETKNTAPLIFIFLLKRCNVKAQTVFQSFRVPSKPTNKPRTSSCSEKDRK